MDEFVPYVAGLVQRERARRRRMRKRATKAQEAARTTADLLRQHYGATRVRLFGSVLHSGRFHERSDVDLAVEGLAPADYLRAWALLNDSSADFEVDLVDPRDCSPYIWKAVEREGVDVCSHPIFCCGSKLQTKWAMWRPKARSGGRWNRN